MELYSHVLNAEHPLMIDERRQEGMVYIAGGHFFIVDSIMPGDVTNLSCTAREERPACRVYMVSRSIRLENPRCVMFGIHRD